MALLKKAGDRSEPVSLVRIQLVRVMYCFRTAFVPPNPCTVLLRCLPAWSFCSVQSLIVTACALSAQGLVMDHSHVRSRLKELAGMIQVGQVVAF